MRVAVLGLYDSGSTCLAGVLHHLGVDMGAPFWKGETNFFEPYDLSCMLRHFWAEPRGVALTPPKIRIEILRNWILMRESFGSATVGAKHPLFCLGADDLASAWGQDTFFLWSYRNLEKSIERLKNRGWFGSHAEPLQRKLWQSVNRFKEVCPSRFEIVEYRKIRKQREKTVNDIIGWLGLAPTQHQFDNAVAWIIPLDGKPTERRGS